MSTYTATAAHVDRMLDAHEASETASIAMREEFGDNWEQREGYGDRYIGEADTTSEPVFLGRYGSDDPGRWSLGPDGDYLG